MRRAPALSIIAAAIVLTACGDRDYPSAPVCTAEPIGQTGPVSGISPAVVPATSPYDAAFEAAADEFEVPADLLRAIGYVETRWEMVVGTEGHHGLAPAYGVMALRGERLSRGAELAAVSEEAVRTQPEANIRAAAALLRSFSEQLSAGGVDEWLPAVRRYSGIELTEGRVSYGEEVFAVLEGRRTPAGAALLTSTPGCGGGTPPKLTDYDGALWQPSPNYNQRMSGPGGDVHMVIIHSCEGAYTGCWSWLANPASGVSAHYVVREDGAQIRQLVRESARAWHIGATYDSTLNAGHAGELHGIQSNHFTIGVEHAGYASQTSWPEAQIDASAKLVCEATRSWNIPVDELHIVSHGQLQPYNRTDPGAHWPWDDYLAKIESYCG